MLVAVEGRRPEIAAAGGDARATEHLALTARGGNRGHGKRCQSPIFFAASVGQELSPPMRLAGELAV
jgi:hypothetical protein